MKPVEAAWSLCGLQKSMGCDRNKGFSHIWRPSDPEVLHHQHRIHGMAHLRWQIMLNRKRGTFFFNNSCKLNKIKPTLPLF